MARRDPSRSCARAFLALLVALLWSAPALAWESRSEPNFFPSRFDAEYFADVALQAGDGVVVAGTHGHPHRLGGFEWDCTLVVARLVRRTGAVDWRTELPDCGDDESYDFDPGASPGREHVLVDASGAVVVARLAYAGVWLEVTKLSAGGDVLWSRSVARVGERVVTRHAAALDAAGNVVVAAGANGEYPIATELFVAKLSGESGDELWRFSARGTSDDEDYSLNRANAVAVDAAGDLLVHGQLVDTGDEPGDAPRPLVLKLSGADGSELWRADGLALDAALLVAASGDPVVAGGGRVVRFANATGAVLWSAASGAFPAIDTETKLALDAAGRVAVASEVAADAPDGREVVVTLLDVASGALARRWTLTGARLRDVALDASGRVLVAGAEVDAGGNAAVLVAALDLASDEPVWRRTLDGTEHAKEAAFALVADGDDVVVAGGVGAPGAFTDAFVWRLDARDGRELWIDDESALLPTDTRGIWLDETALDAAIDARGDVVAVGRTWQGVEAPRWVVRKLDGETGARAWDYEQLVVARDPPRAHFDYSFPEAVALDPVGDVFALATEYPATVTKLDGAGGDVLWRETIDVSPATYDPTVRPLAVDAAGDAFVGGHDFRPRDGSVDRAMVVKKLSGQTGSELWEGWFFSRAPQSIALDPAGDVLASGQGSDELREVVVVKLDGRTGAERWRYVGDARFPGSLVADAAGDVLVGAARVLAGDVAVGVVVKVAGATGAEAWTSEPLWGATVALATDAEQDVLAVGYASTYRGEDQPLLYASAAAKLDGASGATLWRRPLGELGANVQVLAATVDADGSLVVAAREVPGRTWLARLAADDGRIVWALALGERDDVTFDVRALHVRRPGEVVVAGGLREGERGLALAVLSVDTRAIGRPAGNGGRRCTLRLAGALGAGPRRQIGGCTRLESGAALARR